MGLKFLAVLVLILGIFSGCSHAEPCDNTPDIASYELSGEVVDGVRVVRVEAYKFGFSPENIVVKNGEKVKMILNTRDVAHGIFAKGLGIDIKVEPGVEAVAEFTTYSKGVFPFSCNVYCGSGHSKMGGLIIVK